MEALDRECSSSTCNQPENEKDELWRSDEINEGRVSTYTMVSVTPTIGVRGPEDSDPIAGPSSLHKQAKAIERRARAWQFLHYSLT